MRTLDETGVISAMDKKLLLALKRTIQRFLPTATVLLYGSVARGTQDPESDYDVLILTDPPVSRQEESRIEDKIYEFELEHGVILSTVYCARSRWDEPIVRVSPFHGEVERDAILL